MRQHLVHRVGVVVGRGDGDRVDAEPLGDLAVADRELSAAVADVGDDRHPPGHRLQRRLERALAPRPLVVAPHDIPHFLERRHLPRRERLDAHEVRAMARQHRSLPDALWQPRQRIRERRAVLACDVVEPRTQLLGGQRRLEADARGPRAVVEPDLRAPCTAFRVAGRAGGHEQDLRVGHGRRAWVVRGVHLQPGPELLVGGRAHRQARLRKRLVFLPEALRGIRTVEADAERLALAGEDLVLRDRSDQPVELRLGRVAAPDLAEVVADGLHLRPADHDALGRGPMVREQPVSAEQERAENDGVEQRFL